jgi:hypothetical protein
MKKKESSKVKNRKEKNPKRKVGWFVYWTPRILSIILIAFLALFSLDVFSNGLNFWQVLFALLIHNIPTIILLLVLIISWKYEIVGGIAFILAGLLYIFLALGRNNFEWYLLAYSFIIAGPAFLIGILFLVGWHRKRK